MDSETEPDAGEELGIAITLGVSKKDEKCKGGKRRCARTRKPGDWCADCEKVARIEKGRLSVWWRSGLMVSFLVLVIGTGHTFRDCR